MKNIKLYIHPCFPKTGSTFFQQIIISKIENLIPLRKPYFKEKYTEFNVLFEELFIKNFVKRVNNENNILSYLHVKEKFINHFYDIVKKENKKSFILSDEDTFGLIGLNGLRNIYIFKELVAELKKKDINVELEFILTIRSQAEFIQSSYAYNFFYWKNIWKSFDNFKEALFNVDEVRNIFNYYEIYHEIYSIFKIKPILLPIELLEKNNKKYLEKINKIFNSDLLLKDINFNKKPKINSSIKNGNKIYFLRQESKLVNILYFKLSNIHIYFKKFLIYKKFFYLLRPLKNLLEFLKKKVKPQPSKFFISFNQNEVNNIKKLYYANNKKLEKFSGTSLANLDYY